MDKINLKIVETDAQKYWSKQLFDKTEVKNPITDEMVDQLLNPGLKDLKKLFKEQK